MDGYTKDYPFFSSYSSFANNPILIIDENGDKLYVYGTEAEWKKMKSVLEKEFGGFVEFKRDKNNMIYAVPSEKSMKSWGNYIASVSLFSKSPKLKQLMTIIEDKKDTKLDLVVGEKAKKTVFGGFRGGTTTGNQTIDMADILKLEESVVLSPFADIMHEFVEAYEDQVTNGKPAISGKTEAEMTANFMKKFSGPHASALIAQAESMGYSEVQNVGTQADKEGKSEVYFIGIKKDGTGNITQVDLTIVKMKNNSVESVKNIGNVKSFTTDAKTGKAKYTGGTEIKK